MMDPRHSAQHPFSRPPSHQTLRDSRFAPIPPPPYSSQQSAMPADSLHGNDPFLRRRNERDDYRTSSPLSNQTQPYTLPNTPNTPNYTASPLFSPAIRDTQTSRTPYGNGRSERYTTQRPESGTYLRGFILLCCVDGCLWFHKCFHLCGTFSLITISCIYSCSFCKTWRVSNHQAIALRQESCCDDMPTCARQRGRLLLLWANGTSLLDLFGYPAECAQWHHCVYQPVLILNISLRDFIAQSEAVLYLGYWM